MGKDKSLVILVKALNSALLAEDEDVILNVPFARELELGQ